MSHEQLKLPITVSAGERAPFDADAVAKHIGSHAPSNPYASQERRAQQIAERYAATYTPDNLPEHLRDAAAAAEAHFAKTAPGSRNTATSESGQIAEEIYVDPTTGEVHEIDQDRPFTDEDADRLAAERKEVEKARADARQAVTKPDKPYIDPAAAGIGRKAVSYLAGRGTFN